jgi:hypothetical protein
VFLYDKGILKKTNIRSDRHEFFFYKLCIEMVTAVLQHTVRQLFSHVTCQKKMTVKRTFLYDGADERLKSVAVLVKECNLVGLVTAKIILSRTSEEKLTTLLSSRKEKHYSPLVLSMTCF